MVESWVAEASLNRAEAASTDLTRRLESIRIRLEQGGLSAAQQEILNKQPRYNHAVAALQTAMKLVQATTEHVSQLKLLSLDGWDQAIDTPSVTGARQTIVRLNERLQKASNEIKDALAQAHDELALRRSEFDVERASFTAEYEQASQAQSHLAALLAEFRELSAEQEAAERNLQEAKVSQERYRAAKDQLDEARATLDSRLSGLREILNEAAAKVMSLSSELLRAHVEEESVPARYLEALMDLTERCGIRDVDSRCRELVEDAAKDGRQGWEELVQKLLQIRRRQVKRGDGAEVDPQDIVDIRAAIDFLTENQARSLLGRLDDDRLARFLSAWASPFIRFEYRDRGSYMPFDRASPGQQASALLTLLLNQEAGTLIIDQPEDDLDTRVIMTIAKQLQTTKRKRQLIFATHNPNFVVNGDADKVIALAPNVDPNASDSVSAARIAIEEDGAIETPEVRKAITETMEGGIAAFELRGRKYASAKEATRRSRP